MPATNLEDLNDVLSLPQAAQLAARLTGRSEISTYAWLHQGVKAGIKGVRLKTRKFGRAHLTTVAALGKFLRDTGRLNGGKQEK